jgi:hypothetical protein
VLDDTVDDRNAQILLKTRKLSRRENLVFARVASSPPIVLTAGHLGASHAAKPVGPPNPQGIFHQGRQRPSEL